MPTSVFWHRFGFQGLIRLINDASQRFPITVLATFLLTLISLSSLHQWNIFSGNVARTSFFLGHVFLYSVAIKLYAESHTWSIPKSVFNNVIGIVVLAAINYIPDSLTLTQIITGFILFICWTFVPFVNRQTTNDSIWYYNYLNLLNIVFAGLSTLILCIGLLIITTSIKYLFQIPVPDDIYGDIWIIGNGLFFPIYLLSQLPRQFDSLKEDCHITKGIFFIGNYLLVPLCLIYMFILYGYFVKIVLQWSLPCGNLANMVSGFGIIGIITHLIIYPMKDNGTRLLQEFDRYFYKILIVPLLLLAIGIYTRISHYGVTEQRYYLVIILLWLGALSLLDTAYPRRDKIKYVPFLLAALLLASIVEPIGARAVSVNSQVARLEALLRKNGVLQQSGEVVKAKTQPSYEDSRDVSSIMDYLYTRKSLRKIKDWSNGISMDVECRDDFMNHCSSYDFNNTTAKIMATWNIPYIKYYQRKNKEQYTPDFEEIRIHYPALIREDEALITTTGYDYMVSLNLSGFDQKTQTLNTLGQDSIKLLVNIVNTNAVSLVINGNKPIEISLQPIIDTWKTIEDRHTEPRLLDKLTLQKKSDKYDIKLHVLSMDGEKKKDKIIVRSAFVVVLIRDLNKK